MEIEMSVEIVLIVSVTGAWILVWGLMAGLRGFVVRAVFYLGADCGSRSPPASITMQLLTNFRNVRGKCTPREFNFAKLSTLFNHFLQT